MAFLSLTSALPAPPLAPAESPPRRSTRPARWFWKRLVRRLIRSRRRHAEHMIAQYMRQRSGPPLEVPSFLPAAKAFVRASADVWRDAREHHRAMAKRHPIVDG